MKCLNEVELFFLHMVFLPWINSALDSFLESWNNHPVSTEHNRTLNQLFVALRQNMIPTPHIPTHAVGNIPIPTSSEAVEVPRSAFLPCDRLLHELERHDMLHASDDFGYSVYKHVCRIVGSHLRHCNDCS